MPALVTERLRLVPVTLEAIEGVLLHDRARAEAALEEILRICGSTHTGRAKFPPAWPNDELVSIGFPHSLDAIRASPQTRLWGDSLVLPLEGPAIVLGSVVFKGLPPDGIAEVGYAVVEDSRSQGFATEATQACVEWALAQPGIHAVQATTFPWHHASLGVIRKCGMTQVGTRDHEMLGDLLVFERRRS
jgi:ribosomal-protein-alanine N-acetyltransferase